MARDEQMIAALKRERATYVSRGDTDRVAQVDEQLRHYGYDAAQDADPAAPAPLVEGPQGRTAPARQTAAAAEGADDGTGATGDRDKATTSRSKKTS